MIKRLVALVLVLILCIESFAAVVSDNDGSAFITKAEFDSLKNDFQSQIDQYNTSIDSKIDGAIASYLSGIKVAKKRTLTPLVTNYSDIMWQNDFIADMRKRTFSGKSTYVDLSGRQRLGWNRIRTEHGGRINLPFGFSADQDSALVNLRSYAWSTYWLSDHIAGLASASHRGNLPSTWILQLVKDSNNQWVYNTDGRAVIFSEVLASSYSHGPFESHQPQIEKFIIDGAETSSAWAMGDTNWGVWADDTYANLTIMPSNPDCYLTLKSLVSCGVTDDGTGKAKATSWYQTTIDFDPTNTVLGQPMGTINWGQYTTLGLSSLRLVPSDIGTNNVVEQQARSESQAAHDLELLGYLMLGETQNYEVNVGYWNPDTKSGEKNAPDGLFDFKESQFETCTFSGVPSAVVAGSGNGNGWPNATLAPTMGRKLKVLNADGTTATRFIIDYPLWPRLNVRDLVTSKFNHNGSSLKIGQGIPLLIDFSDAKTGICIVKFKPRNYNANLDDTSAVNADVQVSLKKSDFLSNDDYYEDLSGSIIKNKQYSYAINTTNPNGEVKIQFQIDSGNDVWMQIGPIDADTYKYYTKIEDMELTIEVE